MSPLAKLSVAAGILGALVAAIAAISRPKSPTDASPSQVTPTAREVAPPSQHELAGLRREVHTVKSMMLLQQAHDGVGEDEETGAGAEEGAQPPDPEKPSVEERRTATLERVKQRERVVLTTMHSQGRDEPWATEVEQSVRERVAQLATDRFPTRRMETVECMQSICTVRVATDSKGEATAMLDVISELPGISATFGMREEDPDTGAFVTVVYLGREGHTLPQ